MNPLKNNLELNITNMKNFDSMTGGLEKMGMRREFKKEKQEGRKHSSSRIKHDHEDYEEYFNTRYGNKLSKS